MSSLGPGPSSFPCVTFMSLLLLPTQVTVQSPAIDPSTKEIQYNPTYEELFAPQVRTTGIVLTTWWGMSVRGTNDGASV